MLRKVFSLVLLVGLLSGTVYAQQSVWQQLNREYHTAMELYEKGNYVAAAQQFGKVQQHRALSGLQEDELAQLSLLKENARFYIAICALELQEPGTEDLFLKFIRDYPASANAKAAYYQVGRSYFAEKDYHKTIEWFDKLEPGNLAGREYTEYRYKLAYSYFMTERLAQAKPLFAELKDGSSEYAEASIYYYAYISYMDGEYKTALREFERLKGSQTYV